MEFFSQDNVKAAVAEAMSSPDFNIKEFKYERAFNIGNTKMGKYYRMILLVEYPENVNHTLNFFAKFVPEVKEYKDFVRENDCFAKEAHFYSHIASMMETLLPSEIHLPTPICYFAHGEFKDSGSAQAPINFESSAVILQDLSPLGYQLPDMWTPLDLPHCRIVMRALARFHGGSILLQHSNIDESIQQEATEAINSVKESIFIPDEDSMSNKIIRFSAEATTTVICDMWPNMFPKGKFYQRLLDVVWNSWKNVFDLLRPTTKYENVICHGELCGNNILFAYEREQRGLQKPVDVKFIDMQVIRYAPPVTDILLFLHVCTRREFRNDRCCELLSYYYTEFVRAVSPKVATEILSLDALKASMQDMQEFGLMSALYFLPLCFAQHPGRMASIFHLSDVNLSNMRSSEGSSSRRHSSDDAAQMYQENPYSLLENQSSRILKSMKENQVFKVRLLEAYQEYLEFVGLWEGSKSN